MSPGSEDPAARGIQFAIIVAFTLHLIARIVVAIRFPVVFQEAHYWEWSRFPSLGYLDQPPLVAWVTGLFGLVFPERSSLALRAGSLLFGSGAILLTYRLAFQLSESHVVARRAMMISLSMPVLFVTGCILSPDAMVCFFQLLSLTLLISAVRKGGSVRWGICGVAGGLALLSDLRAVIPMVAVTLFAFFVREARVQLRRPGPYFAALVAVGVFSPFLYWNAVHEWPTLAAHTLARYRVDASLQKLGEFLGEVVVSASPFLVVPLAICLARPGRWMPRPPRPGFRFLRWQSLSVLGVFLVIGAVYEGHPHWTITAFPPAAVLLALLSVHLQPRATRIVLKLAWVSWTTILVFAVLIAILIPRITELDPSILGGSLGKGLAKAQTRLCGWAELHREIQRLRDEVPLEDPLLFTWDFEEASMLSYHHAGEPFIALKSFMRPRPKPGDAQVLYLSREDWKGRSGILLTTSGSLRSSMLSLTFDGVEELAPIEKTYRGRSLQKWRVFRLGRFRELTKLPR